MWRRRAVCALSLARCVRRAAATVSVVTSTTAADDATARRCARRSAAVAVSGETIARVLYSYRQCADDDDDDSGSLRAQQQHWQEQQQQQQHNSGDDEEEDNVTALLSSVTSRQQQQQQEQQQSPRRAEEDALRDVLDALIALPPQHSLRAQWAMTACQLAHRNGLHAHCIELYFVCVRDTLSMLADALPPTARSDAAATAKATMTAQPPLLLVALTTAHDDALLTMVMQSAALLRDATALRRCYDVVLHLAAHERRALSSSSSSGRWCAGRTAVHASRLFALCALLALRAASSCRDVAAGDVYRVVAYDALAFVLLPPSSTAHAKQQEQQWHRRGGHGNNNDNESGEDEARARRRCCRRHLDELMHTVQYSSSSSSSSSTMSQHNTLTTASIDAVSAAVLIYLFHRWCDVYDRVDNDPATATKGRPLRAWLRPAVLHALLHAGVAQRRLDVCELAALYIDRYVAESTADDAVGTAAAARTATTTSPPPPRAGNDGKDVGEALSSLVPLMLRFFAMTATAAATTSQQQQQQQQNASATRARRWLQWLRATQPRWQPPRHAVVAMARVAGSVRDVALATWCLEALLSSGDVGGSGGAMTASSPPPLLVLPPSAADVFVCVSAVAQCGVTEGQLHSVIRVLHEHALLRLRDEEALYVRLLRCARDAGARVMLDDVLLPQLLSHLSRSSSSTGGRASGGDDDAWLLAARAPRGVVTRGGGAVPLTMQCVYAALVALHACGHARFFAYYVQFCRLHDARRMTAAAMRVERARWAAVALRWAIEQHGGRASGDGRYDEQAGDAAAVRGIARDAARQLMALGGVVLPVSSPAALRRALRETTATLQRHCAALRAQHSPAWWRRCFAAAATSRDDKGGAAAAVVDEAARALFAPSPTSRAPPSLCVLPSVASPSFARPLLRRRCALRGCAADAATLFARTTMALHTAGGDGNGAATHATRAARARWQGGVLS